MIPLTVTFDRAKVPDLVEALGRGFVALTEKANAQRAEDIAEAGKNRTSATELLRFAYALTHGYSEAVQGRG